MHNIIIHAERDDDIRTTFVCTWHAEKNGAWRQYSGFSLSGEQLLM